jgi:hypothetical protein
VEVAVNVDASLLPATVEVRLGGRLVETREVAPPPGGDVAQPTFSITTAARDAATGAPLYPNGAQTLAVTLRAPMRSPAAGCPAWTDESTVTQAVTLANP